MKRIIIAICLIGLISCKNDTNRKNEQKSTPDLMFETEHCRYYCLQENAIGACKVSVCECDSGYQADVSVSW